MELSLSDVTAVLDVARRVDANPLSLAARIAGFSGDEQQAGVPTWAWVVLALGGGAALALVAYPRVSRLLSNEAPWLSQGGKGPSRSRKVFGRWS